MGVQINDCYKSISAPSEGIFKDKGSKFLAFAYPVESEAEIKDLISKIKKEYFDARHHCYAYRLRHDGSLWRANDDGEPSSSAGRPILGQILSNELSDILIVVVRYFGGIKLGVPGLIRAYKTASSDAIENSTICEKIATNSYSVSFPYERMNDIMKILKDFNIYPYRQEFDNMCLIETKVRLRDEERFVENISDKGYVTKLEQTINTI
jgi:uncharacterized YigZ family protein